jgi:hypothetical protein
MKGLNQISAYFLRKMYITFKWMFFFVVPVCKNFFKAFHYLWAGFFQSAENLKIKFTCRGINFLIF